MAFTPLSDRELTLESVDLATDQQTARSNLSQRPLISDGKEGQSASLTASPRSQPRQPPKDDSSGGWHLPGSGEETRKNSLRQIKDSTEVLRQRSSEDRLEARRSRVNPAGREGHHFTVGNVGTGGKLYLRPTASQPRHSVPSLSALPSPHPPLSALFPSDVERPPAQKYSIWSDSQASGEQGRAKFDGLVTGDTKPLEGPPHQHSNRTRAFSFSTVDETHKSLTRLKNGVWRIVIDRSTTSRPKSAEQWATSDLEVAVPEYGVDIPSSTLRGLSSLPDSAYTYTSEWMYEHPKSEHKIHANFIAPARPELQSSETAIESSSGAPLQPSITTGGIWRASGEDADTSARTNYKAPIDNETFDRLANCINDESAIRYSTKTGAIKAATPARIVAHISSESFMDYDLVSDFFLTFRAYLSTEELLSLLLARLSWAINRLENDGRVIRIRTFAALRHWILNYFLDDFVLNRKLRVQFCNQINDLYGEVSKRVGSGVSDLKILQDLKRCWNGRCSTYWDSNEFVLDAQQEGDIRPGGIYGSRDPIAAKFEPIHDRSSGYNGKIAEGGTGTAQTGSGQSSTAKQPPARQRKPSLSPLGASALPPEKQKFQPPASSVPTGASKPSPPPGEMTSTSYPATAQPRTRTSPASPLASSKDDPRRLSHVHVRSASTSDSTRDQASPGPLSGPKFPSNLPGGSLIRGSLYPPAQPFVDVIAPDSPPGPKRRHSRSLTSDKSTKLGTPGKPGTKKLMGTIRRALSSKHSPSSSAFSKEDISQYAAPSQGKTSGLPPNMTRSTDNLRDKKSTTATRRHLRIDLLCAAVSQTYQMTQTKASQRALAGHDLRVSSPIRNHESESQKGPSLRTSVVEPSDVGSLSTHTIAQSGPEPSDGSCGLYARDTSKSPLESLVGGPRTFDAEPAPASILSMPLLATQRSVNQASPDSAHNQRSWSADIAPVRRSNDEAGWPSTKHPSNGAVAPSPGARLTGRRRDSAASSSVLLEEQSSPVQSSHVVQDRATFDIAAASIYSSGNESESDAKPEGSDHPLRRRPGGNLRKIENVHDLAPRVRRQSTGSLNTRTDSVGSLLVIGGHRTASSRQQKSIPHPLQQPISMLRTHSSQHIRPSFEAAVSGFSTIPDDGDGGLEATLLKLEGRYDRALQRTIARAKARSHRGPSVLEDRPARTDRRFPSSHQSVRSQARQLPIVSSRHSKSRSKKPQSASSRVRKPSTRSASARSGRSKSSVTYSEDSDSSIPLLERGLFDESMKRPRHPAAEKSSVAPPQTLSQRDANAAGRRVSASSHPSIEVVRRTESINRIPQGSTVPNPPPSVTADSFLLDDDDHLTDLSSELSVELVDGAKVESQQEHSANADPHMAVLSREVPTHPLAHPPSPASSFHHTVTPAPTVEPITFQQKPLTPQPSPTQVEGARSSQLALPQVYSPKKAGAVAAAPPVTTSAGHIPFVLACESVVLAEQLTLVEKAALSEVDWSDLVDMKWDNNSPKVLNWVEYLAGNESRGIDIVVARFNIVVKWVISEIVMTQDLYERAQAITKFIHVAAHTRHMQNYPTTLQITIALTSMDCSRLKGTWIEVPELEKAILKELEALAAPTRGFQKLRREMETANLQDGFIPFLGLYVHDLTYNAQQPSRIKTTPDREPLVNFEKYRTIARTVKNLLRRIDASTRYTFSVVPGVIERCLWLAALDDERIAGLSRSLEA